MTDTSASDPSATFAATWRGAVDEADIGPGWAVPDVGAPPSSSEPAPTDRAAQNLGEDQYEQLADWFGCRPRQLDGMTETIPAVLTDSADAPGPDTMGYVTPGCDVDVQDASCRSSHPGVLEAAVVGAPDDVRDELPRTSVGKIRTFVLKEEASA